MSNLPQYRCFKVVHAAKIVDIFERRPEPHPDPACGSAQAYHPASLVLNSGTNVEVDSAWMARSRPVVGGYYVKYEDGYTSFSPAQAFETGYIPALAPTAVLDPGHRYLIAGGQVLQFLKKEKQGDDFVTVAEGTTNEGLLEVLIDRTKDLNARFPCRENALAITKMEEALHWFEARTRDRQRRQVEGTAKA